MVCLVVLIVFWFVIKILLYVLVSFLGVKDLVDDSLLVSFVFFVFIVV